MARPKKVIAEQPEGEAMPVLKETEDVCRINQMNDLAFRIWEGQSIDLPINERTRRIVAGLNAQGYTDTSTLSLPKV